MKRLIKIWLVLFPAYLFAHVVVTVLGFKSIDLRFEVFAQIILVPSVQSVWLWWAMHQWSDGSWQNLKRELGKRQQLIAALLLVDCAILVPSWLLVGGSTRPGLIPWDKLPTYYAGVKGLAAGVASLFLVYKRAWSARERAWLLALAIGLTGYALDCFANWLAPLVETVSQRALASLPLLLQWLFLYGFLFVTSVLLLFKIQKIWTGQSALAAAMLDGALAFAWIAALVVVLGFFNRPYLVAPWSTLVKTCGVLFMTAVLIGLLQLLQPVAPATHAARRRR